MSAVEEAKPLFAAAKVKKTLIKYLRHENYLLRVMTTLCLTNIEEEEENKVLKDCDSVRCIVRLAAHASEEPAAGRAFGVQTVDLVTSLGYLALHDNNKLKIVDADALKLLNKLVTSSAANEKQAAAHVLSLLVAHKHIKHVIQQDKELQHLLELKLDLIAKGRPIEVGQIVLSVPSLYREAANTIMHELPMYEGEIIVHTCDAPHTDWEKIGNDLTHCYAFIYFLSKDYEVNPFYRIELQLAMKKPKPTIPLLVEKGYTPPDWLQLVIGDRACLDFTDHDNLADALSTLTQELERLEVPSFSS